MLTRLLKNKDFFFYYVFFALKGIALYLVLYLLNVTSSFVDLSKFVYFYSLFLVLIPVFNMGLGSYLLRHSYSNVKQLQAISLLSLFVFVELITSSVLFFYSIDYAFVALWATFKSLFTAYEAYLVSRKKYKLISLSYLYQFLMLLIISLAVINGYITSLGELFFCMIFVELISLPVMIKKFTVKNLITVMRGRLTKRRIFNYLLPVVGVSFMVAFYINLDKVFIGNIIGLSALENYGYLFIFIFAIHRFITTPFIMSYSSSYYLNYINEIPNFIVFKGMVVIVSSLMVMGAFFYVFQKDKFSFDLTLSFSFFIVSLFLLNLQMLYFKKKHLVKLIFQKCGIIVGFSAATLFGYLVCFGFEGVEFILVLNSAFSVFIFSQNNESVDVKFIFIFYFLSVLFCLSGVL